MIRVKTAPLLAVAAQRGLLLFAAVQLSAQPASITSIPRALFGPPVFDSSGNLYYVGTAAPDSSRPVTSGAAQTQGGGGSCIFETGFAPYSYPCDDAYIGKTDASGKLAWATLLGGPTDDQSNVVAVDAAGNVFVAGITGGSFPTTANAALAKSSAATAFAAKISADGSQILYSTYLPETTGNPRGIAVDAQGNAYVSGDTTSHHGYVVKISADGSAFLYYSKLAGNGFDSAGPLAVDAAGNVTVAGSTSSTDLPVRPGALQTKPAGMFVMRLDAQGNIALATYLGGSGVDKPDVMRIGPDGSIYIVGAAGSLDFPTTPGSFQPAPQVPLWNTASVGGFVTRISAGGDALVYSTYAPALSGVLALAVSASGEAYIAGLTGPSFPVTLSAPQICFSRPANEGQAEAVFAARLDARGALLDATYVPQSVAAYPSDLFLPGDGSAEVALSADVWRIVFGGADWTPAACLSSSVLNGATLTQGVSPTSGTGAAAVVPGEVITLTGFGIGPDTGVAFAPGPQGQVPSQVAGVEVLFDGKPAPVLYAQSRQINAVAPLAIAGQTSTNITVMYNNVAIGSTKADLTAGMPGLFRLQPNVSSQAFALNDDLTVNSADNPAPRGSTVALFGTGFGVPDSCTDGALNFYGPSYLPANVTVSIKPVAPGGTLLPTTYAGGAPTLVCGVVQINVPIPTSIPPGKFSFSVQLLDVFPNGRQGEASEVGADIAVK